MTGEEAADAPASVVEVVDDPTLLAHLASELAADLLGELLRVVPVGCPDACFRLWELQGRQRRIAAGVHRLPDAGDPSR